MHIQTLHIEYRPWSQYRYYFHISNFYIAPKSYDQYLLSPKSSGIRRADFLCQMFEYHLYVDWEIPNISVYPTTHQDRSIMSGYRFFCHGHIPNKWPDVSHCILVQQQRFWQLLEDMEIWVLLVLFLSQHIKTQYIGYGLHPSWVTLSDIMFNLDPLWVSQTMAFLERSKNSKDVKQVKFSTTASLEKWSIFLDQVMAQVFGGLYGIPSGHLTSRTETLQCFHSKLSCLSSISTGHGFDSYVK